MPLDQNSAPLLNVEGMTTYFDITGGLLGGVTARVHAVEDISFHIKPAETLAMVGESGCGKSTTGRTLIGLEKATAGKIEFDGVDLTAMSRSDRRDAVTQMQMIFQDPYSSLNPRQTVGTSISEPMLVHNIMPKADVKDHVVGLLRKVGLQPAHFDRYPHEFSGGQRQRICIARALGLSPRMIIADEAVSALDVTIQAQVINLFMGLQEEFGLSLLFISHDMAVVERIAHRVAVMYLGRIVEMGPRREVFDNPQHSYTQKLLSAVPIADPTADRAERGLMVDEIPSAVRALDYKPGTLTFREVSPGHMVANEE
ncbi:MAG: ATP-binding cassette domain-containing protein [Pseudomonadota bacterium]